MLPAAAGHALCTSAFALTAEKTRMAAMRATAPPKK